MKYSRSRAPGRGVVVPKGNDRNMGHHAGGGRRKTAEKKRIRYPILGHIGSFMWGTGEHSPVCKIIDCT